MFSIVTSFRDTQLMAERGQRFAPQRQSVSTYTHRPTFALHEAALRDAGFEHVDVIWQRFDNRVLMAIRAITATG